VILRLLLGMAEALYFVAGFAALADLAPPGRAGEAQSFNSLAVYVGIATGPDDCAGVTRPGWIPPRLGRRWCAASGQLGSAIFEWIEGSTTQLR
jgi:MFS family permease